MVCVFVSVLCMRVLIRLIFGCTLGLDVSHPPLCFTDKASSQKRLCKTGSCFKLLCSHRNLLLWDGSLGTIDDLAQQYAEYFGTHTHDVTARMEELQHRQMAQNSASFCNSKNEINLPDSDKRSSFQTFEDTSKGREETARPRPQSLKNIQNQRGSEETASCRGCGGVNFVASEIKMSDEDRIRLMNMVKDNRISIDEALAKAE
uniref:Uncharacterized protein n=1 Tax=Eptatretus burgeri TaxID=7764 RepID=A0A8C4WRF6_EPTBU